MSVNPLQVIVGQANFMYSPSGTAVPVDATAFGTADWPTPWVQPGATEEGLQFLVGTNTQDITIEEQPQPVDVLMTSRNVRVQFALSEDVVENMLIAYGGGTISTVAAASAVAGKKVLTLKDSFDRYTVAFTGKNALGFQRFVYIANAVSVADVTTAYRRAQNNRAYNVEFRAICPSNQIQIADKTAAALP